MCIFIVELTVFTNSVQLELVDVDVMEMILVAVSK
jgi:hypothetical protein